MPRPSRTARRLAVTWAVIVILLVVVPNRSSAQTAGSLSLDAVSHSADGTTVAALSGTPEELASLAVTIDGAATPFEVISGAAAAPARVVFAIENSVSMTAFQLAEVQSGARSLVDSLDTAAEVGIVLFGGGASTTLPLTTDRSAFESALNSITLDGGSALYSGVVTAGELLQSGSGPALIVLVTYGWDWGSLSTHTREASFAAVSTADAAVYVQGMVFDGSVDVAYLAALATDGIARDATQVSLLANATSLLGAAAPLQTLTVRAPALALGAHELRVTSGTGAEQVATFEVVNDGLMSVSVDSAAAPDSPLVAQISTSLPLSSFEVTATLAGTALEVSNEGTISIDPWTFAAGIADLEVQLAVSGQLAAASTSAITIPTLEPLLVVDQAGEATVVASLLAQPNSGLTLVAVLEGAVIAESADGTLTVDRRSTGALSFEARSADGAVVATERVSATAAAAPSATSASAAPSPSLLTSPTMLALPLVLLALALIVRRRRAAQTDRGPEIETVGSEADARISWLPAAVPAADLQPAAPPEPAPEPVAPPERASQPTPFPVQTASTAGRSRFRMFDRHRDRSPPLSIETADWSLVVRLPDGEEQRIEVGDEPVSFGASKLCTVTLDGEAVRFVHLVIAREGHQMTAHQFGPVSVNGQNQNVEDETVLTDAVMKIGDVAIWLERTVADSADVDAA